MDEKETGSFYLVAWALIFYLCIYCVFPYFRLELIQPSARDIEDRSTVYLSSDAVSSTAARFEPYALLPNSPVSKNKYLSSRRLYKLQAKTRCIAFPTGNQKVPCVATDESVVMAINKYTVIIFTTYFRRGHRPLIETRSLPVKSTQDVIPVAK